jgi:hypothetical protein
MSNRLRTLKNDPNSLINVGRMIRQSNFKSLSNEQRMKKQQKDADKTFYSSEKDGEKYSNLVSNMEVYLSSIKVLLFEFDSFIPEKEEEEIIEPLPSLESSLEAGVEEPAEAPSTPKPKARRRPLVEGSPLYVAEKKSEEAELKRRLAEAERRGAIEDVKLLENELELFRRVPTKNILIVLSRLYEAITKASKYYKSNILKNYKYISNYDLMDLSNTINELYNGFKIISDRYQYNKTIINKVDNEFNILLSYNNSVLNISGIQTTFNISNKKQTGEEIAREASLAEQLAFNEKLNEAKLESEKELTRGLIEKSLIPEARAEIAKFREYYKEVSANQDKVVKALQVLRKIPEARLSTTQKRGIRDLMKKADKNNAELAGLAGEINLVIEEALAGKTKWGEEEEEWGVGEEKEWGVEEEKEPL